MAFANRRLNLLAQGELTRAHHPVGAGEMSRYFFHVSDGTEHIDREGVELSGPDQARIQAVVASGEMLKDLDGGFWKGEDWQMRVVDETGGAVCTLRFSAE